MFVGDSIGVGVPEVAAACLDSLAFLVAEGDLDDVLVPFLAVLFEFGLDGVGDVFAEGVEIGGGILLFGDQLVLEDCFNELAGFGGSEFLAVLGLDLVLADAATRLFRHLNIKFYISQAFKLSKWGKLPTGVKLKIGIL